MRLMRSGQCGDVNETVDTREAREEVRVGIVNECGGGGGTKTESVNVEGCLPCSSKLRGAACEDMDGCLGVGIVTCVIVRSELLP